MDYLKPANLVCEGALDASPINAKAKRVVIVGGGDTGADCLGTVHRQGAASVSQLEILPRCRARSRPRQPVADVAGHLAHLLGPRGGGRAPLLGGDDELVDDGTGAVGALRLDTVEAGTLDGRPAFVPVPGSALELEADLVLIAMGFLGPEVTGVWPSSGSSSTPGATSLSTSRSQRRLPGVFACGDMVRGQSLIVWAIAEGRSARLASTAT